MKYLLDTNVLSEAMKAVPDQNVMRWLDENEHDSALSVIAIAELADGIEALPNGKRKASLAQKLDFMREDFSEQILDFDEACAWEWARYCNAVRVNGGEPPVLDSLIAATAQVWGLIVVTRNEKDFPLMSVLNPFGL